MYAFSSSFEFQSRIFFEFQYVVSSIPVAQMETLCGTTIESLLQDELKKTGRNGMGMGWLFDLLGYAE